MSSSREIIRSPRAADRIAAAREWLEALPPNGEALVVAANWDAADDLVRAVAMRRGALSGIHRLTFNRLLGLLAADSLAETGIVPAAGLAAEAVVARTVFRLAGEKRMGYFEPIATQPGFPGALARTLAELRLNRVQADRIATLDGIGAPLAGILRRFEAELADAKLIDRAGIIAIATEVVRSNRQPRYVGLPTLLFDVAISADAERGLIAALVSRAQSVLATVLAGDMRSERLLADALGVTPRVAVVSASEAACSLARLQDYLFENTTPTERALDDTVTVMHAAGEMHECVEIARRIQAEARDGVPFDRIAVLLHAPSRYAPYLEEALRRADVPAYFARGTARPEPGGRALLALLACAAERLSARRFAEYLSLAQVPDYDQSGVPRAPVAREFVAPDLELAAGALAPELEVPQSKPPESIPERVDSASAVEGTLRAPWRWEQLLVDAAVIGSRARWERRLSGLEAELRRRREELKDEEARAAAIDRRLADLAHLRTVALPIIGALASLPEQGTWAEWLERLRALVGLAIRDARPVLAALAELEPMGPVGPIGLEEVRLVLAERLGWLEEPPPRRRYGAVFVAPVEYARGVEFDVVIIPGLAERIFPQKLTEDPILADRARAKLDTALTVQRDRVAAERLALRIGVGAAKERVMLSYPRVDLDQGRPRVPSFYALEIFRAAEGRLPGFDELGRRAASDRTVRLGWPAPANPEEAVDNAEFDLAVLEKLLDADPDTTTGAANYLLDANAHLGRALRARARRWLRRWTQADGLVDPDDGARAALARHQLAARSYSPTALQHFAGCSYRFFLQAIHRLEPREDAEPIEVMDPLTRGALFHEVQFEILSELRALGLLPVSGANLAAAQERIDNKLKRVAAKYEEELAPAITRVWEDGIDSIRADLREWLRRCGEDPERWLPERFELAFGLTGREQADPASSADPVEVTHGLKLRGSIDLVERGPSGKLRATDHKTGRAWAEKGVAVGGGKILQPVLYALAAEKLLSEPVEAGRLYYCTAAGGYEERVVALDEKARAAIGRVIDAIASALSEAFLPAAPDAGECSRCDYRRVCGPYEEIRSSLKPVNRLNALTALRSMP
jgi:ATP-dependent helicase/nuclease subunit B